MIESLNIGRVKGDFLRPQAFIELARKWISGNTLRHVVTLNPEMVMRAENDSDFLHALGAADLRVPDGAGIIWAHWYLRSSAWALWPSLLAFSLHEVERITGVDTVKAMARVCEEARSPLYLLGGSQSQVESTAKTLLRQFLHLTVHVSMPHMVSLDGPPDILEDIHSKHPLILLVAYGAPAQTIWIERNRAALQNANVRIAVGVGGAFAILSEETPRAPLWMRKLNMEWLWRLVLEPGRLPRIWSATVRFPRLIQRQKHLGLSTPP